MRIKKMVGDEPTQFKVKLRRTSQSMNHGENQQPKHMNNNAVIQ
jgi:hypothetical protein